MSDQNPVPQLPAPGQIFLDHVGWFTHDMAQASELFERLGFPLTPFSVHGDRDPKTGIQKLVGTANRLAMLDRGYLEILTPVDGVDSPVVRHMNSCLERYTGVHLVAFGVADAEADRSRLADTGFGVMPTVNLRRTVELEDGSESEVAFTVVRVDLDSLPEARMQVLTHHTPDEMWQGRYLAMDNGVRALNEVLFVAADPKESAAGLARFTGRQPNERERGLEIALDRGRLRFMTPADASAYLGGAGIVDGVSIAALGFTGDPEATIAHAKEAGVAAQRLDDGRALIPSDAGMGCYLLVEA